MLTGRIFGLWACALVASLIASSHAAAQPCQCTGDVNGDGTINIVDFQLALNNLGCTVGGPNPSCAASDVNCDGFVDQIDLAIIQCQFGQPAPGDPSCCVCPCNADVDGSGVIDLADIATVVGNVGCPVGTGNPACDRSDLNCDGVVDAADVRIARCQAFQQAPGDPSCCDCDCDADVNGDNAVDANDAIIVSSRFGCVPFTGDPICDASDINCDGVVDQADLNAVECSAGQDAPDPRCCCRCTGDINGDGIIDGADLNICVANQGCPVGGGVPLCDRSDVNCDGVVDLRDIRVIECQFGQPAPGNPACCDVCACSGDVNNDQLIDGLDLQFVLARFGCPVGTGDPLCDRADVNCDGWVDIRDANVIECQFGQAAPGDVQCCDVCDCSGDVNDDGQINAVDLGVISAAIGCTPGSPPCDRADVNCDGVVDIRDLAIATCQFGDGRGDPALCDETPGACCFACDGYPGGAQQVCADLSQLDCAFAQGIWLGAQTDCSSVSCVDRICPGDVNKDGVVNVFDFADLSANFGTLNTTPGRCLGDLNCDGRVDVFDFGILAGNFGCPNGPPPPLPRQCCLSLPSP